MHVVILAGGSGTRFWPLSRRSKPKQLLALFGDTPLIEQTIRRLEDRDSVHIVCNQTLVDPITNAVSTAVEFVVEPQARNTLPAIALATYCVGDDEPVVVLPSDHFIGDVEAFRKCVNVAVDAARQGDTIVTIGVQPTRPETGFGYIQVDGETSGHGAKPVLQFVEKPDARTALNYLQSGNYLWNAGMFVFRPSIFKAELQRQQPDTFAAFEKLSESEWSQTDIETCFNNSKATSIDFGLMENAASVHVVPGSFGWSDVGHWDAMFELYDVDDARNVTHGDHTAIDSHDCLVWSESRHVAAVGLERIAIVETEDAVLVCHRDNIQKVRDVVSELPDVLK